MTAFSLSHRPGGCATVRRMLRVRGAEGEKAVDMRAWGPTEHRRTLVCSHLVANPATKLHLVANPSTFCKELRRETERQRTALAPVGERLSIVQTLAYVISFKGCFCSLLTEAVVSWAPWGWHDRAPAGPFSSRARFVGSTWCGTRQNVPGAVSAPEVGENPGRRDRREEEMETAPMPDRRFSGHSDI